ncbi:pilus assembly FimT family protein [Sorangium sp. So ce1335]|uniref:pilus assembly FimT family protein n=1 Tax=Sorangium sp. So ce1335 TaxID=3133335 RepID=UPI003F627A74
MNTFPAGIAWPVRLAPFFIAPQSLAPDARFFERFPMKFHNLARIRQGMRLAFARHSVRSSSCSRPALRGPDGPGPSSLTWRAAPRRGRRRARGFTLPELLAVVVLIGILAAAASPSFVNGMRDRRVNRTAMEISGIYRLARHQAMGRGTAVLVRWSASAREFEVRQARIEGIAAGSMLSKSCLSVADWMNPAETELVTRFNVTDLELASVELRDPTPPDGVVSDDADVCFTARGRTFVRYNFAAGFTPLLGAIRVNVTNTRTGLLRSVFVPPNGVARLGL